MDLVVWDPDDSSSTTLAEALDCDLMVTTGGDENWGTDTVSYYGGKAARSGSPSDDEESWMQTTVDVNDGETVSFYWKVSSDSGDRLNFYIDEGLEDSIGGEVDWQKKSYSLSAGSRTLKWVYDMDSNTRDSHPLIS